VFACSDLLFLNRWSVRQQNFAADEDGKKRGKREKKIEIIMTLVVSLFS
jgi:hypothetical protein